MGKIKFKRYPAATLVETIVALVIILALFGIASTVLIQTNKVSYSTKKIKADYFIDQFARETDQQKSFSDNQIEMDLFTIKKKIDENKFQQKVVLMRFSAIDKNGRLVTYQNRIFRLK
jgi:outer membrane PBP1 activator LpoA protein